MSNADTIEQKLSITHGNRVYTAEKMRVYTAEKISELITLFVHHLKSTSLPNPKGKFTYSKKDIYHFEEMWRSFVVSVIMKLFERDWEAFHRQCVASHDIEFVPIYRKFSKSTIKKIFDTFLQSLPSGTPKNKKPTRHAKMLELYDISFYNTVIHVKYRNNRQWFFKDLGYTAQDVWFEIKKLYKIDDKTREERVKWFIDSFRKSRGKTFSSVSISDYSNGLFLDLIRHFRDEHDHVDRLFILTTLFKDPEIITCFDPLFKWDAKKDDQYVLPMDIAQTFFASSELDPEETLIAQEDEKIVFLQKELLQKAILTLNSDEQKIVQQFHEGQKIEDELFVSIIHKLRSQINQSA